MHQIGIVNLLRPVGSMDPASARFPEAAHLPKLGEIAARFGLEWGKNTPVNVSF